MPCHCRSTISPKVLRHTSAWTSRLSTVDEPPRPLQHSLPYKRPVPGAGVRAGRVPGPGLYCQEPALPAGPAASMPPAASAPRSSSPAAAPRPPSLLSRPRRATRPGHPPALRPRAAGRPPCRPVRRPATRAGRHPASLGWAAPAAPRVVCAPGLLKTGIREPKKTVAPASHIAFHSLWLV